MIERPLAITDVKTTGLSSRFHEIIDVGLVVVEPDNLEGFEIKYVFDYKVKPLHPERATPKAVEINGYNKHDWRDAHSLESIMKLYAELTKDAVFVARNVTFDWSFIEEAFRNTQVENLMDYHRIDLFSLAWAKKNKLPGLKRFNLNELCKYFGIPEEPLPHTGINGAMCEWEVLKKLSIL